MSSEQARFWERKTLEELDAKEWEMLCDGCARCCLHKFEDEHDGTIEFTDVACRLLDRQRCRCTDYANRTRQVPDCVPLQSTARQALAWLPDSCAYRRVAENRPLAWWHPLVSGDPNTVHEAGISVRGRSIAERAIDPERIVERISDWVRWTRRDTT